ncbi:hypothetical protein GURASL_20180 [Geotalea uraniireducens]|uniref:Tetratricopeptide repeat protein n=1 Tax=Geotalea uraniireducens TaxID=351604 RepID=A0ABM8ELK5_9BACT|nr:hypothetical protein [Geotalea uraniireducens]BDV43095.1 hypothetical protein GURASL_20180 [Geotalea uraniireducens]
MTDYLHLGFSALQRGDCQEALNIFRRAQEGQLSARSFVGLGEAWYRLGDLPTARWAFHKALALDPAERDATRWVARLDSLAVPLVKGGQRRCRFRAATDFLQLNEQGRWRRFFVKGINLGLGLPGYFPGEYPIVGATYRTWFKQMEELGVNSLRIYAVHPPSFYEALADYNEGGGRLFLFQGIWLEPPEQNDFRGTHFLAYLRRQIREAVDAVCGVADFPERPGMPHGAYRRDVSPYTAAFVVGREWESCAVKAFNESHGRRIGSWRGSFLEIADGSPFEVWATECCDYLQDYEQSRFGCCHPVTIINWPTLDPLAHPSESTYEQGLRWQGIEVDSGTCSENEDVESFDPAKIVTRQGGGFFASYHVYPYYPDFLNNDDPTDHHPYRSYLQRLKDHHGRQPVVIAEFGVPSSREPTHWQKNGWHHGGHNDAAQGEINGRLMTDIRDVGMAGGMLFSWFDEWFKRNWVFYPYELPADRNPCWFNLQDAEQCYGLLAAYPGYPGKLTNLAGNRDEWRSAEVLYEQPAGGPAVAFNDGNDPARTLRRLSAQHDEGFFYLLLETAGPIDFRRSNFLLGLDTCGAATGETRLPCGVNAWSPLGLSFVIHLAGEGQSRILVCRSYDKYLNEGTGAVAPRRSDLGEWVMMQNITNHRRISKDGSRFYPARVFSMSGLRFGSLDPRRSDYDSLADCHVSGTMIELRLPWGLLNITDPSSRQALWIDPAGKTRTTTGIAVIAGSFSPSGKGLQARTTGLESNLTDTLPSGFGVSAVRRYQWAGWSHPLYHTYLKRSYDVYRAALALIAE